MNHARAARQQLVNRVNSAWTLGRGSLTPQFWGPMARFSPRGPPMYTEEYRQRGILSPRVGRPLSNATLKASPPSTPRAHSERVKLVSPRLPVLDGRKVRGASLTARASRPAAPLAFDRLFPTFSREKRSALERSLACAGIRPVNGQTSLSRVSISSGMPYKAEFTDWGDFVQTNNTPGGEMHSTNWSSVADMERAKEIRLETDRNQRDAALVSTHAILQYM